MNNDANEIYEQMEIDEFDGEMHDKKLGLELKSFQQSLCLFG